MSYNELAIFISEQNHFISLPECNGPRTKYSAMYLPKLLSNISFLHKKAFILFAAKINRTDNYEKNIHHMKKDCVFYLPFSRHSGSIAYFTAYFWKKKNKQKTN